MMIQREMDINGNAVGIHSIQPHHSVSYDDYYRHQRGHRSESMALSPRKDANKRRLLRRVSQSFIPNCVLVPNRNPIDDLYKMFPQLPPGEKPLNGFSCALYKDILLQGKMTICSSCICFHSNIFGYETRVIIHFKNVLAIKREKTAFVVPNAISIRTLHKRYLFCSFLSREASFKLLSRVWKCVVNEDNGKDGRNETEPIKIKGGPREENTEEDILNLSSSTSSYGSTFPASISLPERPHSSPPSLGGIDYNEIVTPAQTPRADVEDCVFTLTGNGFNVSTDFNVDEQLPDINHTIPTLRRVKSTTNISEVEALGHRFCFKNLERLRDERMKQESSKLCTSGKLCSIPAKLKEYLKISNEKLSHFTSLAYSFKTHHPFVLVISLLVLFLAILSFNLLLRINGITESLHSQDKNEKFSDNVPLKDVFDFKEGLHSANVERVRSILSVNLETVSEVQKTLKELREKLKSNN